MNFVYNDGGRIAAGFKTISGDCVCRAICIAANLPYKTVYDALAMGNATQRKGKHEARGKRLTGRKTASEGISTDRKWFKDYMAFLGFEWVPTMRIGQGCKTHLVAPELPSGRLVVSVSKHMVAVIDGVLHDLSDCSRDGKRCVYGYYILKSNHHG